MPTSPLVCPPNGAADRLITDEDGRLLVLDPPYKLTCDIPGGVVEVNSRRGGPRSARCGRRSDLT
jgi:hypothetical protein